MINSIPKIESKKIVNFGNVSLNRAPSDFWLPAKDTVEISKSSTNEEPKRVSEKKRRASKNNNHNA